MPANHNIGSEIEGQNTQLFQVENDNYVTAEPTPIK